MDDREKYEKEVQDLATLTANLECRRDHNCRDCAERNHILTCQERYLAKRLLAQCYRVVPAESKIVPEAEQRELIAQVEKRTAAKVLSRVYKLFTQYYDMTDHIFELISIGLDYHVRDDPIEDKYPHADQ